MIKTLLKQTSLVALSLVVCSITFQGYASGLLDAGSIVDGSKFLSTDQGLDDIVDFAEDVVEEYDSGLADMVEAIDTAKSYADIGKEISNIGNKFSKQAKDSISKAKEEASSALNTFEQGAYGMKSTFSSEAMDATVDGISQDIKKQAKDMATGKGLLRGLNARVTSEMKEMSKKTSDEGAGFPTIDPANLTAGMFNLDSVFGANMANGGVRRQDTKMCSGMGLKDAKRGDGLGMACCLQWVLGNGEEPSDTGSNTTAEFAGALAICCAMAPEYCLSFLDIANEKAACVNGKLSSGATAQEAWKTCEIECGKKGYGELVHNEDEKYDPKQIEDLMKECYAAQEDKWQPSPMVLTASEMAPVVPDDVKGLLK